MNTITGKPVPKAKTKGRYRPEELEMVIGINIPKNSTPLYGQKAKANITPSENEPSSPLFANFSEKRSSNEVFPKKFKRITFSMTKPIIINNGPRNFSPFWLKKR